MCITYATQYTHDCLYKYGVPDTFLSPVYRRFAKGTDTVDVFVQSSYQTAVCSIFQKVCKLSVAFAQENAAKLYIFKWAPLTTFCWKLENLPAFKVLVITSTTNKRLCANFPNKFITHAMEACKSVVRWILQKSLKVA
jgi:hypothetical protein